jgi:hypothetical protein
MSSLSGIVSEMKEIRPVASVELETVPRNVRVGMEGRKNAAVQRLQDLEQQYAATVWGKAVFVVPVNGTTDQVDEFSVLADGIGEFMPVDYTSWDKSMGQVWWDANGKKGQTIDTVHTVQLYDALRVLSVNMKLENLETPAVPRQIFLGSLDDCTQTVKKVTTDGCGIGFRLTLLEHETAKVARELEWAGADSQPVPFVLLNATADDLAAIDALSPNKFYKVDLSTFKEIDEESVKKTLEKVVKAHKKK